jgi:hypothetical protein
VDLVQQRCSETDPIRAVPAEVDADICPYDNRLVDRDVRFRTLSVPEANVRD